MIIYKRVSKWLQVLIFTMLSSVSHADLINETKTSQYFDVSQMQTQIHEIEQRLEVGNIGYVGLLKIQERVKTIQNLSSLCMNAEKNRVKEVNELLSSPSMSVALKSKLELDLNLKLQRLYLCKLTAYRADEVLHKIIFASTQNRISEMYHARPPIWEILSSPKLFKHKIVLNSVSVGLGLNLWTQNLINTSVLLIIAGFILGAFFYVLARFFVKIKTSRSFLLQACVFFIENKYLVFFIWPFLFETVYMTHAFAWLLVKPSILYVIGSIGIYILLLLLFRIFLAMQIVVGEDGKKLEFQKQLYSQARVLLIWVMMKVWASIFVLYFLDKSGISLFVAQTLTIIGYIGLYWFGVRLIQVATDEQYYPTHKYAFIHKLNVNLRILLKFFCIVGPVLALLGYVRFSGLLDVNLILSAYLIWTLYYYIIFLRYIEDKLQNPHNPIALKLYGLLGYGFETGAYQNKPILEFLMLRILLSIQMTLIILIPLFAIWQLPQAYIQDVGDFFINGFLINQTMIIPIHIFRGAVVFCLLTLIGRLLATYISKQALFQGEIHRQITAKKLTQYIVVCLSVVITLKIMGVDLKGMGFIIGALSVGIGFGLQRLVADFIAGITILLQNPVKIGDHVLINNVEGYIQKIFLLSSQIKTLNNADLIIPNSQIISSGFINYTFKNKLWTSKFQFALENLDDLDKARQILMEVATAHPEVMQDSASRPQVLLEAIFSQGSSYPSLNLWCTLKDVNKNLQINSELNFAIMQKFQDQNIQLHH